MRLIDAEALKKSMWADKDLMKTLNPITHQIFLDYIDNAPTVEYPFYQEAYQTGYEEGKNDRPQGKWIYKQIHDYDYWECSNCGELCTEGTPRTMNFCPNCGADMRKGEE